MKLLQKRPVAALIMVAAIALGVMLGQARRPVAVVVEQPVISIDGSYLYVYDTENVISESTKRYIEAMNESLFVQTGAQIVVDVLDSTGNTDIAVYTEQRFNELGIGSAQRNNGILLVLALENYYNGAPVGDYYMGWGSGWSSSQQNHLQNILWDNMEQDFAAGDYDSAVLRTFDALIAYLEDVYGVTVETITEDIPPTVGGNYSTRSGEYSVYSTGASNTTGISMFGSLILILLVLLMLFVLLDRVRYNRYRRRYLGTGMGVPPVVYYPIFWGRPRRPRPPRPPRPPRGPQPPRGGGGTPPRGGSGRPGGTRRPPTGGGRGGFGGGSFGGGAGRGGFGGGSFGGGAGRGGFGGGSFGGGAGRGGFGGGSFGGGAGRGGFGGGSFGGGAGRGGFGGGSFGGGGGRGGFGGGSFGGGAGRGGGGAGRR